MEASTGENRQVFADDDWDINVSEHIVDTRNGCSRSFFDMSSEAVSDYLNNTSSPSSVKIDLCKFYDILEPYCKDFKIPLHVVIQTFESLDSDCNGGFKADFLDLCYRKRKDTSFRDSFEKIFHSFTNSKNVPGIVDVFGESNSNSCNQIVEFLFRNRSEVSILLPKLERKLVMKFEEKTEKILRNFNFYNILDVQNDEIVEKSKKSDSEKIDTMSTPKDISTTLMLFQFKMTKTLLDAITPSHPNVSLEVVKHARWILESFQLFQLSPCSNQLEKNLDCSVVKELQPFIASATSHEGSKDLLLWFHLVCGDVCGVLESVKSEVYSSQSGLENKMRTFLEDYFAKGSIFLPDVKVEFSDGDVTVQGLSSSASKYSSASNSTQMNLVVGACDRMIIKSVTIEFGSKKPKSVQFYACRNKSCEDIVGTNFEEEGTENLGVRLVGKLKVSDFQSQGTFCFDKRIFNEKILLRFQAEEPITAIGVKFHGLPFPKSLGEFMDKFAESSAKNLNAESLLFLASVAACQKQKRKKTAKNAYNFSYFNGLEIDYLTGILRSKMSSKSGVAVAKNPLSEDCPQFEIEVFGATNLQIVMGLVSKGYSSKSQLPGNEPFSIAFNNDNRGICESNVSLAYVEQVKSGDKLCCSIEFRGADRVVKFVRNGTTMHTKEYFGSVEFFPAVAISHMKSSIKLLDKLPWRSANEDPQIERAISLLDVQNINMESFVHLLKRYNGNDVMMTASLHFLLSLLPFIVFESKEEEASEVLVYLCRVIDSEGEGEFHDDLVSVAEEILSEGAEIFFTSKEERLRAFFEYFGTENLGLAMKSKMCIFESLCKYFTNENPQLLLNLPKTIEDFSIEKFLSTIKTFFTLIQANLSKSMESSSSLKTGSLFELVSSIQKVIFAWCSKQSTDSKKEELVYSFLSTYVELALSIANEEIDMLLDASTEQFEFFLSKRKNAFLSTVFEHLLLLLSHCCDWMSATYSSNILVILSTMNHRVRKLMDRVNKENIVAGNHWFLDLLGGQCYLVGKLSGMCIQMIPDDSELRRKIDGSRDEGMLTSEIWRLIFRGGLQTFDKQLFQRSLSGKHEAVIQSEALSLLLSLNDEDDETAKNFLRKCRELSGKTMFPGGSSVTSAINALFGALTWHTQPIREDIEKYIAANGDGEISEGVLLAFKTAESLRMPLMSKRQDLVEKSDETHADDVNETMAHHGDDENIGSINDDVDPIISSSAEKEFKCPVEEVRSKSEFLLQFAGLQKSEGTKDSKCTSCKDAGSDGDVKETDVQEMYPSFRLVLEFVKDSKWSQSQVESLLETRRNQANKLVKGYKHVREFFEEFNLREVTEKTLKICIPSFLGGLMMAQDWFPKHYLEIADGCGLLMESKVRREFYHLISLLLTSSSKLIQLAGGCARKSSENEYMNLLVACTLHIVDVDWKVDDLPTVVNLEMADFLLSVASGFQLFSIESTDDEEETGIKEELLEYEKFKVWLQEVHDVGTSMFVLNRPESRTGKGERELKFFLSRHQKRAGMGYACDFCRKGLELYLADENVTKEDSETEMAKAGYWRCRECIDFDICKNCVEKQESDNFHLPSHKLAYFKYVCRGCEVVILTEMTKCEQCPTVQWCNGCTLNSNWKFSKHTSDHITRKEKVPTVNLKQFPSSTCSSYCHHHAALIFSNLSLASQNIFHSNHMKDGEMNKSGDVDYLSSAFELYKKCVEGAVRKLSERAATSESEPGEKNAIQNIWRLEDLMYGLLCMLLPRDKNCDKLWSVWLGEDLICLLINIIIRSGQQEFHETKLMALNLLKRIFKSAPTFPLNESMNIHVDKLFHFGCLCIKKGHLPHAKLIIEVFNSSHDERWKECLVSKITSSLHQEDEDDKCVSVFAAYILAGFPQFSSFGSLVRHQNDKMEEMKGIVLEKILGEEKFEVVDVISRKKEEVEQKNVCISNDVKEDTCHVQLESLIDSLLQECKIHPTGQDVAWKTWFLSVLLKAEGGNQSCLSFDDSCHSSSVRRILSHAVERFARGTQMSENWTSESIEILTMKMASSPLAAPALHRQIISDEESLIGADPLADVEDPDLKLQLEMLSEEGGPINRYVCRAIYNLYRNDRETLADNLTRIASQGSFSDEVKEALKEVEAKYKISADQKDLQMLNKDIDHGFSLGGINLKKTSDFQSTSEVVFEEGNMEQVKLMSSTHLKREKKINELKEKIVSNEKMMKACMSEASKNEEYKKEMFKKASEALASLFCERLLTNILTNNKFEDIITTDLISLLSLETSSSNIELWCIVVMKLLSGMDRDDDVFIKMLKNVLSTSTPSTLMQLLHVAHNFMTEMSIAQTVSLLDCDQGIVDIKGANVLSFEFFKQSHDSEANQSETSPTLLISFSPSFDPLANSVSLFGDEINHFILQEGKFYYKVEGSPCDVKFKVTGKVDVKEYYDTGFSVFRAVVGDPIYFSKIDGGLVWNRLSNLFCMTIGSKRLEILSLLLDLLKMDMSGLDFSLLGHVWNFYKRSPLHQGQLRTDTAPSDDVIKPALFLGLTELFRCLAQRSDASLMLAHLSA